MSLQPPLPDPGTEIIRRYVIGGARRGRYLKLLGGNFVRLAAEERATFVHELGRDARQVTDAELEFLLQEPNWRPRIAAGWLIGSGRREQFRERLGTLLMASEYTYACQSYCIALAMLGTREDAEVLTAYLDHYLRRPECRYDQPWALGALLHLDDALGSNHAEAFLEPGGLWESWTNDHSSEPTQVKERITEMRDLTDRYAHSADEPPSASWSACSASRATEAS
ncbi:DUF6000 family protein [Embleya sp. MST-111070]|uniref:DUF6000 family protein n=1 Tax=Embleya sp. MST-111070 TaxID=3398231 RepID=UPI003F739806